MRKRRNRCSGFTVFLTTYALLLCLLIAVGLIWVWGLLKDYETGLAEVAADHVIEGFSQASIHDTLQEADVTLSEFETIDMLAQAYAHFLEGKNITYSRNGAKYTSAKPVYYVLADDTPIAEFTLEQIGENKHGFPVWQTEKLRLLEGVLKTQDITVRVPQDAVVALNGIVAEKDRYLDHEEEIPLAKNIGEYVSEPIGYDVYVFKGLALEPEVEVSAYSVAPVQMDGNVLFYDYAAEEALLLENDELIRQIGTNYGGYLINRVSLSRLSSDLIGNAETMVSDIPAIWAYLYGEEYTYDFTDWNISNGKQYTSDCFSCDLEFTLNVHYREAKQVSYDTKLSCMFVQKDGRWYLADFQVG
jgi:hypothetical protein